jgi:hypothetical protein
MSGALAVLVFNVKLHSPASLSMLFQELRLILGYAALKVPHLLP